MDSFAESLGYQGSMDEFPQVLAETDDFHNATTQNILLSSPTTNDCFEYEDIDFRYDMLILSSMKENGDFKNPSKSMLEDMEKFFCESFGSVKVDPTSTIDKIATLFQNFDDDDDDRSLKRKIYKSETFFGSLQNDLNEKCGFILNKLKTSSASKFSGSAVQQRYKWDDCKEFIIRKASQGPFVPDYYSNTLLANRKRLFQSIMLGNTTEFFASIVRYCLDPLASASDFSREKLSVQLGRDHLQLIDKSMLRSLFRRAGCFFETDNVFPVVRDQISKLLQWTLSLTIARERSKDMKLHGNLVITSSHILNIVNSPYHRIYQPKTVWGFGAKNNIRYLLAPSILRMMKDQFCDYILEGISLSVFHDMAVHLLDSLLKCAMEIPTFPNHGCTFEKKSLRTLDFDLESRLWIAKVATGSNMGASEMTDQPIIDYRSILTAISLVFPPGQLQTFATSKVRQGLCHCAGIADYSKLSSASFIPSSNDNKRLNWISPEIIAIVADKLCREATSVLTYDAFLATSAAVEYVMMELLSASTEGAKQLGTNVVSPLHIERSLYMDSEMLELFPGHCRCGIKIENVHKALLDITKLRENDNLAKSFRNKIDKINIKLLKGHQSDISIGLADGSFQTFDHNGLLTPLPGLEVFSTLSKLEMYQTLMDGLNIQDRSASNSMQLDISSTIVRRSLLLRSFQRSTVFAINRLTFQRCVCDIAGKLGYNGVSFTHEAVELLQVVVENYLISWIEDAVKFAVQANRKIIIVDDLQKVLFLRKEEFLANFTACAQGGDGETDIELLTS